MQCGAKRSTCADCHGVSTTAPWHRDHSFADLCAACHEGRPEEKEATEAHRGLVDPRASCRSCHAPEITYAAAPVATAPPPPLSEAHGRSTPNTIAVGLALTLLIALVAVWRRG